MKAIGAASFDSLALTVKDLPTGWGALTAGAGPDASHMLAIVHKTS